MGNSTLYISLIRGNVNSIFTHLENFKKGENMTLHERIKIKMHELNLNKADLARKTNIPYSTIDNWFKRNSYPSSDTIKSLAIALNTSSEWLITGIEATSNSTSDLPEDEQLLLQHYNQCNQEGKNRIMEQAEFIASKYHNRENHQNTRLDKRRKK